MHANHGIKLEEMKEKSKCQESSRDKHFYKWQKKSMKSSGSSVVVIDDSI